MIIILVCKMVIYDLFICRTALVLFADLVPLRVRGSTLTAGISQAIDV